MCHLFVDMNLRLAWLRKDPIKGVVLDGVPIRPCEKKGGRADVMKKIASLLLVRESFSASKGFRVSSDEKLSPN